MKSKYSRNISEEYFFPLKRYRYDPLGFKPRQVALAEKLSKTYSIAEGNVLRLVMYAERAWSYATESEIQVYYSDMTEIADFEKEPEPITEIFFRGKSKSILITNPYLIDKLYHLMLDFVDFQKILKDKQSDTKKKRPSAEIVKMIATEIYNELRYVEKITPSRSLYIDGYIFALYNIGTKKNDYVMNEQQYKQDEDRKADEAYKEYIDRSKKTFKNVGIYPSDIMSRVEYDYNRKKPRVSYLQYLGGKMRKLIIFSPK